MCLLTSQVLMCRPVLMKEQQWLSYIFLKLWCQKQVDICNTALPSYHTVFGKSGQISTLAGWLKYHFQQ